MLRLAVCEPWLLNSLQISSSMCMPPGETKAQTENLNTITIFNIVINFMFNPNQLYYYLSGPFSIFS